MLKPSATVAEPAVRTRPAQAVLLVVGDRDRDRVDRAFDGEERDVTVEAVATLEDARRRFDDADCLVVPSPPSAVGDGDGTVDGESGGDAESASDATVDTNATTDTNATADTDTTDDVVDRLETIRTDAPELPVVVLAAEGSPELARAVRSVDWTAVIERDEAPARIAARVHDLLERRRLAALSRRSLASLEFAGDAVAIVDPDGEIQFASRSLAMQFGAGRDGLDGTPWRELFTDAAVSHLESTALPAVAEGWRWTGSCTARRRTGSTFPATVRLGGLADGGLVIVVDEADESGDEREE